MPSPVLGIHVPDKYSVSTHGGTAVSRRDSGLAFTELTFWWGRLTKNK